MEKTNNKKVEIFCEVLGYLGYILLTTFAAIFFLVGIGILLTGDFSVFDIFGMVGCFGAGWMLNEVRRGK